MNELGEAISIAKFSHETRIAQAFGGKMKREDGNWSIWPESLRITSVETPLKTACLSADLDEGQAIMYGITVRHFAQRTRKNLASIERLSRDEPHKYFEVTQLINSSVGLLMFPQQEFFDAVPATPLTELALAGWPIPAFEHGGEKTHDLRQLLRYMRNSFAHYNIDFKPERGKIVGLYLWNRAAGSPDWLCYITVPDLRTLFEKFSKLAENLAAGAYSEVRVHHIRSEIARLK